LFLNVWTVPGIDQSVPLAAVDPLRRVVRTPTAGFGGLDALAASTATTMGDGAPAPPLEPERLLQEN
jgi:hypothetical protein